MGFTYVDGRRYVAQLSIDGATVTRLTSEMPYQISEVELAANSQYLYFWVGHGYNWKELYRLSRKTGEHTTLQKTYSSPGRLAADESGLFLFPWGCPNDDAPAIVRVPGDSVDFEVLATCSERWAPVDRVLLQRGVFYLLSTGYPPRSPDSEVWIELHQFDVGSNVTTRLDPTFVWNYPVSDLLVDAASIYVVGAHPEGGSAVSEFDKRNGVTTRFRTGTWFYQVESAAGDDEMVYYTETMNSALYRVRRFDKANHSTCTLFDGKDSAIGAIFVDENAVYFNWDGECSATGGPGRSAPPCPNAGLYRLEK